MKCSVIITTVALLYTFKWEIGVGEENIKCKWQETQAQMKHSLFILSSKLQENIQLLKYKNNILLL